MGPRVAVVGARRRRQGIGEFVARSFHEAGAEVVAVVGTTPETAEEAGARLASAYGIRATPFPSLDRLLDSVAIDIVALCSPFPAHREQLETLGPRGLHCLCEKPLWWGPAGDVAEETARLIDPFVRAGKTLGLVTQWPFTLSGFHALHPELRGARVESFSMLLSPIRGGSVMVPDSMPHVLSMLAALAGPGEVADVAGGFRGPGLDDLEMTFAYRHAAGEARVTARFTRKDLPPRPAAYAVNGREVRREIRLPDYSIRLAHRERSVAIEDPLPLLVRDYLARVARRDPTDAAGLVAAMVNLEVLTRACERWEKGRS